MAEELVVQGVFDPSGIVEGVDIGVASFGQFEQAIRKVAQRLPSAVANEREFAATVKAVAAEVKQAAAEAAVLTDRINALKGVTTGASATFNLSNQAANKFRSGLASMAVQATGTSSAVGQLAQGIAFAFGGGGVVIAAAAAIGALGFAYNKLTESSRELRKEVDALVKSFRAAQQTEADKLAEQIGKVGQAIEQSGHKIMVMKDLLLTGTKFDEEIRRYNELRSTLVDLRQAFEDANRAASKATHGAADTAMHRLRTPGRLAQAFENEQAEKFAAAAAAAAKAQQELTGKFNAFWDDIEAKANLVGPMVVKRITEIVKAQREAFAASLGPAMLPSSGTGISGGFEVASAGVADLNDELTEAASNTNGFFREAAKGADELQAEMDATAQAIADVGYAVQSVVGLMGKLDAQTQQVLASFTQLGIAIARGDVAGIIGGAAGALGGMFGETATQREHNAILQQNTQALANLNTSLNQWAGTLGATQGAQANLGAIDPHLMDMIDAFASFAGLGVDSAEVLDRELRKLGSSLQQLDLIAKANGIQLLDEKGHLVAGALDQLREALKLTERDLLNQAAVDQAMEDWRKSVEEWQRTIDEAAEENRRLNEAANQQNREAENADRAAVQAAQQLADAQRLAAETAQRLADEAERAAEESQRLAITFGKEFQMRADLLDRLGGASDAVSSFRNELLGMITSSMGGVFGRVVESTFGTTSFNTPELREELKNQLIAWIQQAQMGTLTAEDLGLTQDQFNQLLGDSVDFLDSFKDSVDNATQSMLNVPQGLNQFELGALEWQARLRNPATASGLRSSAMQGGGNNSMSVSVGDIVIQGAGQNADQIADQVVLRLKRVSNGTFGDSQRWSQL